MHNAQRHISLLCFSYMKNTEVKIELLSQWTVWDWVSQYYCANGPPKLLWGQDQYEYFCECWSTGLEFQLAPTLNVDFVNTLCLIRANKPIFLNQVSMVTQRPCNGFNIYVTKSLYIFQYRFMKKKRNKATLPEENLNVSFCSLIVYLWI